MAVHYAQAANMALKDVPRRPYWKGGAVVVSDLTQRAEPLVHLEESTLIGLNAPSYWQPSTAAVEPKARYDVRLTGGPGNSSVPSPGASAPGPTPSPGPPKMKRVEPPPGLSQEEIAQWKELERLVRAYKIVGTDTRTNLAPDAPRRSDGKLVKALPSDRLSSGPIFDLCKKMNHGFKFDYVQLNKFSEHRECQIHFDVGMKEIRGSE